MSVGFRAAPDGTKDLLCVRTPPLRVVYGVQRDRSSGDIALIFAVSRVATLP